jgi:hypothetical protein
VRALFRGEELGVDRKACWRFGGETVFPQF